MLSNCRGKCGGKTHKKKGQLVTAVTSGLMSIGRDGVIRTLDPLHPMQVRYQAALRPDKPVIIAGQQRFCSTCLAKKFNQILVRFTLQSRVEVVIAIFT